MAIAFQAAYAIGQTLFGPFINWIGTKSAYAVLGCCFGASRPCRTRSAAR